MEDLNADRDDRILFVDAAVTLIIATEIYLVAIAISIAISKGKVRLLYSAYRRLVQGASAFPRD